MNTKRLILSMLVSAVLVIGWYMLVVWLDHSNPQWNLLGRTPPAKPPTPTTLPVVNPAQTPSATTANSTPPPTPVSSAPVSTPPPTPTPTPAPTPVASPVAADGQWAVKSASPGRVVLGSPSRNDPTYAIEAEITTRGGGLSSVTLNKYSAKVNQPDPYVFLRPYPSNPDDTRVLASRGIIINGQIIRLSGTDFAIAEQSPTRAVLVATFTQNGQDAFELRKTYEIRPRSHPSLGYEIDFQQSLKNLTGQPLTVQLATNASLTPPVEMERGLERQSIAGYLDRENAFITPKVHMVETFSATNKSIDLIKDAPEGQKLMWFGTTGAYFNAILRLDPVGSAETKADIRSEPNYLARAEARLLNPEQTEPRLHEVAVAFQTLPLLLQGNQELTLPMRLYAGPRQRSVLENAYYSVLPLFYDTTLVVASGICGLCTFQWLIKLLVWMLGVFHAVTFDWGLAIICLVLVVRAILHPITKKSQVNMLKMGKLGPEMERLKQKFGDDKEGLTKAQMALMKEQGFTPVLGCLPMFLQMPIWLALWAALQSTFELRHEPFFYGLTWIEDLAQPDHLLTLDTPIHLPLGIIISGLNVLPFLLGVVFYYQHKLTPKPPSMSPEQAQQMKIMQWMTLLFPVFLYSGPSGLNLYILTSTAFGILEAKIIRDHIKKREAAEEAGKVLVETSTPSRASRSQSKKVNSVVTGGKSAANQGGGGGITGWWARVQEQADAIRKEAEKKKKKD